MINDWDQLAEAEHVGPDANAPARAVARAAKVLGYYGEIVGTDTLATSLSDLVADLMHLADVIGPRSTREDYDFADFDDVLATARMHYRDEVFESK